MTHIPATDFDSCVRAGCWHACGAHDGDGGACGVDGCGCPSFARDWTGCLRRLVVLLVAAGVLLFLVISGVHR